LENYAQSYPSPKPGWFDIGVLHTSCEGTSGHARYAPCTIADMSLRNYDYWALGHVHAFEILHREPAIVYSGNLQGRSVRECGPKGAVLVEVEDSAIASITHIPFDQVRFGKISIDVTGAAAFQEILSELAKAIQKEAAQAEGRPLALRVEFVGQSTLHRKLKANRNDFALEVQAEADRQRENIYLEKLVLSTSELSIRNPLDEASSLDLAAMIGELADDPALHKNAADIYKQVLDKMPESARDLPEKTGSEDPDAAEIASMIAAAGALILGRAFE
jgi:DNA repair exonuclease SbcCD nuclease subunit